MLTPPPLFPLAVAIEAALYAALSITLALTAPSSPPALLPLTAAVVAATAAQLHAGRRPNSPPSPPASVTTSAATGAATLLFTPPPGTRRGGPHPADALGLAPAALLPVVVCGVVAPAAGRAAVAVGWYVLVYGAAPPRWRRAWVVEAAAVTAAGVAVAVTAVTASRRGGVSGGAGDGSGGGAADAAWAVGTAVTVRAVLATWDGSLTLAEAAAVAHAAGGVARRVAGGGAAAVAAVAAAAAASDSASPAGVPLVADAVVTAALMGALLVGAFGIPASAAGWRWWVRRRYPPCAPTWLPARGGGSAGRSAGSIGGSGGPGGVAPPWWVVTWYTGLMALAAIPTTWLGCVLGTRNPVRVVMAFLVFPHGHAAMLLYWAAVLAAAVGVAAAASRGWLIGRSKDAPSRAAAAATSGDRRAARVVGRKAYHLLAVALFFPALVATPFLLAAASAVALALFLAIEAVRAAGVPPGGTLTRAMGGLLDDRDAGAVVTTHMTLLVGCVLPLWLRLPPPPRAGVAVVGLAAVGVGDAVAAVVGVRWGHHRWAAGTARSVEGSAAGWAAAFGLCALWVGIHAGGGGREGGQWATVADLSRWAAVLGWVSALEAVTGQIDNLVLGAGGVAAALLVELGS